MAQQFPRRAHEELDRLLNELDALLKSPDVGVELAESGINISLALVAADGLRAYLHGNKAQAAQDLGTAAEEIASRYAASAAHEEGDKPS